MNPKTFFLLLLYISTGFKGYSQINSLDNSDVIVEKLEGLSSKQSLDNVYLQTSKGIYETEEDLWFKGYLLDAQSHSPSERSKILFVQLIEDNTNSIVWKEKFEIINGFVDGHLFINDSLQAGNYTLEAYSSHSFYKDSKEFCAVQKVKILKNITDKQKPGDTKNNNITHFTIFPEGGNLVLNIENKVAFKAVNSEGLPIDVSGKLYENDNPLLDFNSKHAGMGSFLFTPNADKKYHIQITDPKNNERYNLPEIFPDGRTLQLISNTKEFITFKVSQTSNLKKEAIFLRLQIRGVVYSVATANLNKELLIKIPLKDIPQGIAEITLFNKDAEPIAERLVYVNQDIKLNIETTLDKKIYNTKETSLLKIKVTDQNGEPVIANLGISIFDKLYEDKLERKNILTHYYLSSQLNGTIYDPAYYFNKKNNNKNEALDLLLLTQGWRRYVWNEENLKEQPQMLLSDDIKGQIISEKKIKKTEKPTQNFVMVFTSDLQNNKDIIMTDSIGRFVVNHHHLIEAESGYLYLKPLSSENNKVRLNIKDSSFDIIKNNRNTVFINYPISKIQEETTIDTSEIFSISKNVNRLKEVKIKTKSKKLYRDKYLGSLNELTKLDNTDYVCHNGLLNCFNHPGSYDVKPIDGKLYWSSDGTRKIRYEGKILSEKELMEKFNLKMLKGFYRKREFYQPIYEGQSELDHLPDYRNTLYWNPSIITDENGEATVTFYCSDIETSFTGNIEGVSTEGLLGKANFNLKVKKKE
ncbi:hypothetical protein [Flavobacterium sp. K5-23]|uniref:hypothetical protein n=1 Tax=Flavobacterium sp. K5-23 TaxID=2746225 RepID=UPI00200DEF10|nr:hypothetical protein [Flavobacterium sp. K5-23]UQD56303.1 hypothetical protein FLAK523_07850 [Flavobacterium sp. K5-23]